MSRRNRPSPKQLKAHEKFLKDSTEHLRAPVLKEYFIHINDAGVYVKDGDFFRSQGGCTKPWGRYWERIEAESLYDARNQGIKLRRERFPDCHKTLGENGERPEDYWSEAKRY